MTMDKTTSHPPPKSKVEVKSRGWFKVWRQDRARIIEQCEGATLAALSVWDALCDLANEHRAVEFEASIGVIRTRAGTSRSTTFRAIELLEELGMLTHKQNTIPGKKNALNVSTYQLLTQSHNETSPQSHNETSPQSHNETSPQSDNGTTPSPSKQGKRSDRGLKKSPKGRQEDKESAPLCAGPACADAQQTSSGAEKATSCVGRF